MDQISPSTLPPLLSMVINGLPPLQQSKYVHEVEKHLDRYVERYHNIKSLGSYWHVGLSSASYFHPGVIDVDRLIVISICYGMQILLDDLFFDTPNEFQDQYGINQSTCRNPENIQEYFSHLDGIFSQIEKPSNPCPLIETMVWELGRDMLELSNSLWFGKFVTDVMEFHRASVTSQVDIGKDRNSCFKDLESYTTMRIGNAGGRFKVSMVEFAKNTYILDLLGENPSLEKMTKTACIHIGYANDVFSYHKESTIERNPRNLITVLMKCEGKPLVATVHKAVGLTNAHARTILGLEARAILDLEDEAWKVDLQNYLQDIKALIAGNIYFCFLDGRYRHPDQIFPELRGPIG